MRAPAARACLQCATTSSTYTTSPELATSDDRGLSSCDSASTRWSQIADSPTRTSPCTSCPSGFLCRPPATKPKRADQEVVCRRDVVIREDRNHRTELGHGSPSFSLH